MDIKYMMIVLKKELKDTFRDRKTIISSIIIPILIFPIMAFALGLGASEMINDEQKPIDIVLISNGEAKLEEYLKETGQINIMNTDDPDKALEELDIKAIVEIEKGFDERIESGTMGNIKIKYDQSSSKSDMATSRLVRLIESYSESITNERLKAIGVDLESLKAIAIESTSVSKDGGIGLMIFSMIFPMLITIYSAISGIAAATDLGAGEKERQTLEPLLTTKASRLSILGGKYLAVFIAGVIGTVASLIGFFIASVMNPDFLGTGIALPLSSILTIGLFCVGLNLVFSGIELTISFYARNFKEAQTYLAPLSIILLIPAYATMYLDGKAVPEVYFHIPIINTIAIIKEAIVLIVNPIHILIVLAWTVVYIVASLFLTVNMFKKESVIFRA
ncbi:sodium transport system permease protein [Proteiniborus ethanoligenes]|uniref:Sodium transport system permease protein n=1 Tax=Proteiniborus ethanoligenes TaxID=415015 RepID=A0A1H3RJR6_9FIRM|nr:ABC transporter permease [Proteiniborus ethanoligenes]SDZ25605.1 sodium transport system permease protein [Proteiniborus ethanoligenes]